MTVFKWLSRLFLYIVPSLIAVFIMIRGQTTSVSFGFAGILLAGILWIQTLKRVRDWVKRKEQAHETVTNLGQVSQTTPFLLLEIVKFIYYSIPMGLLIWIDNVFTNYNGNISGVLGFVIVSYLASGSFNYLYKKSQQVDIQEKIGAKTQEDMAELKAYLNE